jgi:AraC family transcriptional regulator
MKKMEHAYELVNSKIEIKKIKKMKLLYERYIGNYYNLKDFWTTFYRHMEERRLVHENTIFIGISYDDPLITDENRCIYDVCIKVNTNEYVGTNTHVIEEGYYVCYQFHDTIPQMINAFNEIFSIWLPYSGYETAHKLPLEIYHSTLDPQGRIRADICIPIIKT